MEKSVVVHRKLADPRHIELDEPVTEIRGAVEVVLRPVAAAGVPGRDAFDLVESLPAGSREKRDIDRQVADERSSWIER